MNNYKQKYQEYLDYFNEFTNREIDPKKFSGRESDGFYSVLEAMTYSLANGGKRIRPVLTMEFCRLCGSPFENSSELALAVEMVHTYSLIHDDLPCIDNDDMRRSKASNHIVFGYPLALLAGDGLLTLAFEEIAKSKLPAEITVNAISVLSKAAGACGMIAGQVMDIGNENKYISLEDIRDTDRLKTGEMIVAASKLGCIAANANETELNAAVTYAKNIGLTFQIIDDILDEVGNTDVLGKPIGSDKENSKSTYVSILGLEKCHELASELTDNAVSALDVFGDEGWFLKEFAVKLLNREK